MSEEKAKGLRHHFSEERRSSCGSTAPGEPAPPARRRTGFGWLASISVTQLTISPDGDQVQTVEPWSPPDTWDGLDPEALDAAAERDQRRVARTGDAIRVRMPPQAELPGR
jgi:hypothetical protein